MSARQAKKARKESSRKMKAVWARLDELGVSARAKKAHAAASMPQFHAAFNGALARAEGKDPPKDVNGVRTIAQEVLTKQFGVDLSDLTVKVFWDARTRNVSLRFHPEHSLVMQVMAAV